MRIVMSLPGVLPVMERIMATARNCTSMRSFPKEPKYTVKCSGEDILAWFVYAAPSVLLPSLLEAGHDTVAYMMKCLHVVVLMAFHYPVRQSHFQTVMAAAVQYCTTKQSSALFGETTMTFANASILSSPLATLKWGAMPDTCDYDIDDLFRLMMQMPDCQTSMPNKTVRQWYTLVSRMPHMSISTLQLAFLLGNFC